MYADDPAPVSTMRRSGRASSGARKARAAGASARTLASVSAQTVGCWAISRAVHSPPFEAYSASMEVCCGMDQDSGNRQAAE